MTDQTKAFLAAVIDRSGSMSSCASDMEGGFDTLIKAHRELPGEMLASLYRFDDTYDVVFERKPISAVPPLKIEPRGMTALLDAIGRTINRVGEQLAAIPEDQRPGSVEIVVVTDGHENASHEFTAEQVREMITRQQDEYSWKFTFLGANIDAVQTAQRFGIPVASAMTFDVHSAAATMNSYTQSSVAYRGSRAAGAEYNVAVAAAAFSDEDRQVAMGQAGPKTLAERVEDHKAARAKSRTTSGS